MQVKGTHAKHARDWVPLGLSRAVRTHSVNIRGRVVGEMFEIEMIVLYRRGVREPSRGRMRTKLREPKSVVLRSGRRGA